MTDTKKAAAQPSVEKTTTETEAQPKSLDRRAILGLLGAGALLGQACGKGAFSSGSKSGKKIDQNGGASGKADGDDGKGGTSGKGKSGATEGDADGTDAPDGGDGGDGPEGSGDVGLDAGQDANGKGGADGGVDTDTDETSCHANDTGGMIDADKIPEMPDAMKPAVKFYGRDESCMVAMKFGDGAADIKQIILAKENGKLQALHGITAADKKGNAFRPIVVDHINLKDSGKLLIIVQNGDKRFKTLITKAYFTTYSNKPVVDLGQMSVPVGFASKQAVPQFSENTASMESNDQVTYPAADGTLGARTLLTVKEGTTYGKLALLKGITTDVMGETIDMGGGGLLEYQIFCCYEADGDKFVRTMIQVA